MTIERALVLPVLIHAADPVPDPDDHGPVKIHVTRATVTIIPSHRFSVQYDDQTVTEAVKHQNDHIPVRRLVLHQEMVEIKNFAIFFLLFLKLCERKQFRVAFFCKLDAIIILK